MRIRFERRKRPADRPLWMARIIARERAMRWRIAEALRKQAARLTRRQLQWLLVLFVYGGAAVYIRIGIRAVSEPPRPGHFEVRSFPMVVKKNAKGWPAARESFRSYLDGIEADPTLKRSFDSLRVARPGFADTIRRLERLYPRQ